MSNENISGVAFLGLIGMIVWRGGEMVGVAVPTWVCGVSAALLIGASIVAISRRWLFGWTRDEDPHDQPVPVAVPAAAAVGSSTFLIGSHIAAFGNRFTVLDDTAASVAVAMSSGGRAVVTAARDDGAVGLLFLGFTAGGGVVEAATQDGVWGQAQLVN